MTNPPRHRLLGHALLTNDLGHPLLVTLASPGGRARRVLPGGPALPGETALWAATYHARRMLGVPVDPGHVVAVDHDARVSGPEGESIQFVVDCGRLSAEQATCVNLPRTAGDGTDEVLAWGFVDPACWPAEVEPYERRRVEAALGAVGAGCRYLCAGERAARYSVTA
ncbi:hypothetical protein [Streptomyces sp. I05A-00742]|uniref:hypothetical protein n=1 Tax=Streptomyces sp. I05A-00742 TaxID=2732853 RepID=UPI0014895AD1|nr:hypothetical protein [Streptomyces sp. I05A-00742]